MMRGNMRAFIALMVMFFVTLVIGMSFPGLLGGFHANEGYTTATIINKFIDAGQSSSFILVTDKGVFEVDRSFLLDSSNDSRNPDVIFPSIEVGKTYVMHHYGYRLNSFYLYPIVTDVRQK